MATTAEKRAYARRLQALLSRQARTEAEAVSQLAALLAQLRRDIAAELGQAELADWRTRQLVAQVERLAAQVEAGLLEVAAQGLGAAADNGVTSVHDPLLAAGVRLAELPGISPQQLAVLREFSADLIGGVTQELLRRINAQIRLAALGGTSAFAAMQEITRILGLRAGREIVGGIGARAETILRTEMGRAYNLAAQGAMGDIDGALKRWLATGDDRTRATHLAAHTATLTKPIPAAARYQVGAARLLYPGDPAGSAEETINCRCRSVVVHPDLGVIRTELDTDVQAEEEAR